MLIVSGRLLPVAPAHADALSACTFAMSPAAFGQVDVLSGEALGTNAVVTVRCPGIATLLGSILYACISFPTPRIMQGPSATLAYDFTGPPPYTGSWSSSTPVQIPLSLLLNGGSASVTVAAIILAGQQATPPASYIYSGTATVVFGLLPNCILNSYSTSFAVNVSATVITVCNVTAQNIDFGSTGLLASSIDAQGQVQARCSANAAYAIGLNGGISGASDPAARLLRPSSGPGSITYGLYRDSGRGLGWGNTPGSNTVSAVGNAATQTFPIYARIPAQFSPLTGIYSDTIVVTVTY